jgi:S1-C subfamily serine protease
MRRLFAFAAALLFLLPAGPIQADEIETLHEQLLYPVVRIRTAYTGGSGTVIYSQDRAEKSSFRTYVITNHHVVRDAISVKKKWDNLTQSWKTQEQNSLVDVELFSWHKGKIIDRRVVKASVVAHSKDDDIALLELVSGDEPYPLEVKHVAQIASDDEAKALRVFQKIYAVGCSLGHDPIHSTGEITDTSDLIRGQTYMMGSAAIIFGNSGGAVFAKIGDGFRHIGMPSLVAVNGGAVTHMNWFVPQSRIAKFLRTHKLEFFFNDSTTPEDCFKVRDEARTGEDEKEESAGPPGDLKAQVEWHGIRRAVSKTRSF